MKKKTDDNMPSPPSPPPPPAAADTKPESSSAGAGGGAGAKLAVESHTKAAEPRFGASFDPWNSSSSGHQRAENRLGASIGWRDSRNAKLHSQFRGDAKRVSDAVGAGARDWDPKLQAVVPPALRARARCSVADMLAKPGTMQKSLSSSSSSSSSSSCSSPSPGMMVAVTTTSGVGGGGQNLTTTAADKERPAEYAAARRTDDEEKVVVPDPQQGPGRLFAGVVVYVNGSTHPLISDHKLKHVLAEHGGRLSTHLGRKQVTHVILGRPAGGSGGAGGGLAGGKLQREIQKVRGAGVKFVGVEWVLESIKAGKRLPEARFSNLKVAAKGQHSVIHLYSKPTPPPALADSAAESYIDGSGVSGPPSTTSETLGDEPPPSAQRN